MRRISLAGVLLLALAACASPSSKQTRPASAGELPSAASTGLRFACPNGLEALVEFRENAVEILLADGRSFTLPHVPTASGSKYSDGHNIFWEHRGATMIELDGQRLEDCSAE